MLITYASHVRSAPSLTFDARGLIVDIERLLKRLDKETWAYRKELDGSTTLMRHKNRREFP